MQTSYKILFCDGTRDNLIIDGLELSLESNPPNVKLNQGCVSAEAALACVIGYLHHNYKKISLVSGGDHALMCKAYKHSEFCRDLTNYEIVPFASYNWSRGTYDYNYTRSRAVSLGPLIPDEINLEALIPQFDC